MFKQIFEIFKSNSLYEQALEECHEMLDIDLTMFKASINSLRKSDSSDIDIDIFAMDKKINQFERDVRRKVMTHLAVGGKEDIGSGLVLVSVVIDIERIGDYTKNIYDLAVNHPKKLNGGSAEDRLADIENISLKLFEDTIIAFKNQDIEKARGLMGYYKENISSQSDAITHDVILGKIADLDTKSATAVSLYARYLKRISAHSRNLISSVVNPFEKIGYPE
ncbi:MAG: PhoU domain-containing protein [Candidatus Marinimicrobia bacterium]|jgi:phosphate uptake regulator|nr:PhoU domain-containing protein [Candidatus Neomarinimicrobiota bacterium]HJM46450.1 PhoU domain-containing protein [Candidatus Neomarinimicrobiota bacterium]